MNALRSRGVVACGVFLATALAVPSYFRNDGPPFISLPVVAGAAIAVLLALLPASAHRFDAWSRALDALTGRARVRAAVAIGAGSSTWLAGVSVASHRPTQLLWHDEFQFHLQSQMLARFRLWMPAHPLSEFFDTFYVLTTPHYAAQSFPGAALLFVPTVWLHLPPWVMPALVSGAACGLLWWLFAKLANATGATVAIVLWLCTWGFVRVSTMYLAQIPVLVMGLVAFAAMLQWRETPTRRAAVVIGVALGWAAITRPLDATCYGLIVLVGLLTASHRSTQRMLQHAAIVVACAMPFLALQGVFNVGVTGSVTTTPFAFYNQRDQPALAYNGVADTTRRPVSTVPQKQAFYDFATMGFVRMYHDPRMTPSILWRIRLNETQAFLAPTLVLLPFAALGLLSLTTRARWMLAAIAPLFLASYHWYPIYNAHYVMFALPAMLLLFALAPEVVGQVTARSDNPRNATLQRVTTLMLLGISFGAFVDRARTMPPDAMQQERQAAESMLATISAPAIVLFTTPEQPESMHTEYVYNDEAAWPDNAPVIRAHDRGADNIALYRYYASTQPAREVWRFDRRTHRLERLGSVRALANGGDASAGK